MLDLILCNLNIVLLVHHKVQPYFPSTQKKPHIHEQKEAPAMNVSMYHIDTDDRWNSVNLKNGGFLFFSAKDIYILILLLLFILLW